MDRVNEATKDCFDVLIQLRQKEPGQVPPPEKLNHSLRGVVDEVLRRAAVLGFGHQEAQDMAYALVALLDETVLGKSDQYRQFWSSNPLQLHYFNENVAGDGFFTRLNRLRKDAHGTEVLRVYYLCMLFGFQGRYRIRGGELELLTLIDTVQKELERASPFDFDTLAPHGERPSESLSSVKQRASLLNMSLASVGLALLVYGGFLLSLDRIAASELREIERHVDALTQVKSPSEEKP
ncbi:DotU family type IV/VI secretion system protein [Archangium primigenium]|uniref:DotU family type IV/VI secretion system protein n=1 Tax=[Archangium] primigenium TaxID=2792470 RepID=UPI00195DD73A|nr:DotU family type IV/VI secretion system protein [Archangium primigenium]MBM7115296.1 DotU family type IV/VI secretion system protein [Archangium primigenium]